MFASLQNNLFTLAIYLKTVMEYNFLQSSVSMCTHTYKVIITLFIIRCLCLHIFEASLKQYARLWYRIVTCKKIRMDCSKCTLDSNLIITVFTAYLTQVQNMKYRYDFVNYEIQNTTML